MNHQILLSPAELKRFQINNYRRLMAKTTNPDAVKFYEREIAKLKGASTTQNIVKQHQSQRPFNGIKNY